MTVKKEIKRLNKELEDIEDNVQENFEDIQKWVIERRKFFIKLGWVAGFIILLLVLSNLLI